MGVSIPRGEGRKLCIKGLDRACRLEFGTYIPMPWCSPGPSQALKSQGLRMANAVEMPSSPGLCVRVYPGWLCHLCFLTPATSGLQHLKDMGKVATVLYPVRSLAPWPQPPAPPPAHTGQPPLSPSLLGTLTAPINKGTSHSPPSP